MANALGIDFSADTGELIADLGGTMAWSGQTVACTFGQVSREEDVSGDGLMDVRDLEGLSTLSGWTDSTPPAYGQTVAVTDTELSLSAVNYYVASMAIGRGSVRFGLRRV